MSFISLGTGATSGVYYPLGRAICEFVNQRAYEHGVGCSVEATVGSVYNADHLGTQELDLAIMQADVEHDAFAGVNRWSGRPLLQLRPFIGLYPELMTIVARRDVGITLAADLAGKRVDIGSRGTGARATWEMLEQSLGLKRTDLAAVMELRPAAADQALCAGTLDASIQMVGHPSARIARNLNACDLMLVDVAEPAVETLLAANPYLRAAAIPAAAYGAAADTASFGGMAILTATDRTPDLVVEAVTLAVIDHFAELRAQFPVLANADLKDMLAAARRAGPLHPGVNLALAARGLGP